jgi:spermidine synthase
MALEDDKWFTEPCAESGSAFSLELGPGGHLHHERSAFQTIDVYDTTWFGRVMVIDGFLMLSDRDNFLYHEMLVHPAMFSHPDPKRVLIVGGGDCGTLREVLKHACVEQVTQVDIDERVTRVSEQFFPALCDANDDPRATLTFDDAIEWVRDTADGGLDLVIVDSTDPIGPAEGLFGEAFYRDCHRALAPGGLIVQQSESPLAHLDSIIGPMHAAMRAAGFHAPIPIHFPQPVYPTGWWTATIAGRDGAAGFARADDAESFAFPAEYYNAAIHRAAFAQPSFVRRALDIAG